MKMKQLNIRASSEAHITISTATHLCMHIVMIQFVPPDLLAGALSVHLKCSEGLWKR